MPSVSRDRRTQWQQHQIHCIPARYNDDDDDDDEPTKFSFLCLLFSVLLSAPTCRLEWNKSSYHSQVVILLLLLLLLLYSFIRLHQPTLIEREKENQNRADPLFFQVFFIASRGEQNNVASFKMMTKTFKSRAHSSPVPSRNRHMK